MGNATVLNHLHPQDNIFMQGNIIINRDRAIFVEEDSNPEAPFFKGTIIWRANYTIVGKPLPQESSKLIKRIENFQDDFDSYFTPYRLVDMTRLSEFVKHNEK